MLVITSQEYRNEDIIAEKKAEFIREKTHKIVLPVVPIYMEDMYILIDGHHRYAAAKELGIEVVFEEVEDEATYYKDLESQNTDAILEAHWNDSDWIELETGNYVF